VTTDRLSLDRSGEGAVTVSEPSGCPTLRSKTRSAVPATATDTDSSHQRPAQVRPHPRHDPIGSASPAGTDSGSARNTSLSHHDATGALTTIPKAHPPLIAASRNGRPPWSVLLVERLGHGDRRNTATAATPHFHRSRLPVVLTPPAGGVRQRSTAEGSRSATARTSADVALLASGRGRVGRVAQPADRRSSRTAGRGRRPPTTQRARRRPSPSPARRSCRSRAAWLVPFTRAHPR
jgi:hypothetical protein